MINQTFGVLACVSLWGPAMAQDAAVVDDAAPNAGEVAQELNFVDLFADYPEGFTQIGGKAEYSLEDGVLTGTAVAGTPNSFMATDAEYENFVIRYEFKNDPRLNSGVQIRSNQSEGGRFGGPQIEIDHSAAATPFHSAGLYHEGGGGWVYPSKDDDQELQADFADQGKRLTHLDDWNEVVVIAVGHRFTTFLNGEVRVDYTDEGRKLGRKGKFGFQVHSVAKDLAGTKVQWKNVEVLPLADDMEPGEVAALVARLGLPVVD